MKKLTDNEVLMVAVATMDKKKPEVISLINKYGIALPSNADQKSIDSAFISLSKTSDKFRSEFSQLASEATMSFTGNEGFFQATGGAPNLSSGASSIVNTASGTSTGGSVWNKLGEYFSPDVFKSIINTGLNVWSVKQTGQNAPTTQGQMDYAREQYASSQQETATGKSGMGVGTIVLISVGGLLLLGGIIYFATKK